MTAQENKIIQAACEWWLSLAPKDYPEGAHFENSALNTRSEKEAMLAHFVSRYLREKSTLEVHPIVEKEAWDGLQTEIGCWSGITFPNSSRETILRHLRDEVTELFAAQDDELPHEIADCIMLLLHLAHKKGISARDVIREKFEICRKRKWGPPDEHGVVRHVKEPHEDHR